MPIIGFTASDALASKVVEASRYEMEIIEIDGPKQSKSGLNVNFFVTFRVRAGKYEGKEIKVAYSTGTTNSGLLGDMQWAPKSDFLHIEAAINGTPINVEVHNLNTDDLMNKPFIGNIVAQPKEDGTGLVNMIVAYLPLSAGIDQAKPF